MSIAFNDKDHSYTSIDGENIKWISVTSLISHFKQPFDAKEVAKKVSKNKNSKWFGLEPKEIEKIWNAEANRAVTLGTFYHNQREQDLCALASIEREGTIVPIIPPVPLSPEGLKYAPNQKLDSGVYPEHLVYLKSAGICGQSDLVEVVNGKVNIVDYKTNKEIKMESYKNWEGVSQKMSYPVNNLDDCSFYHYALQLSTYMYMILKHNPKLKPGFMHIHHVIFEIESEDDNGYPIIKYNDLGDPVVSEVRVIDIPYLKDEVISIIKHIQENGITTKKK